VFSNPAKARTKTSPELTLRMASSQLTPNLRVLSPPSLTLPVCLRHLTALPTLRPACSALSPLLPALLIRRPLPAALRLAVVRQPGPPPRRVAAPIPLLEARARIAVPRRSLFRVFRSWVLSSLLSSSHKSLCY
jgi:hypothetical protein